MTSKMIAIVNIEFDQSLSDSNNHYAKKIKLIQLNNEQGISRHEICYPSIDRSSERKKNGKHVHFEDSAQAKFINITCELTNTNLGEMLHKYTHVIVETHLEEAFIKEFTPETTKIIVIDK